ncbi:MAG TPA: hypothetical protein VLB49_16315 [Gemmatimonadales bacterium]|nr:hypothetical protein [Gemmatimonadales bacterium]
MILPILPILGAVAVAGGVVVSVLYYERRRRAALEEYCLIRGYRFERERPGTEAALAGTFGVFTQGHRRRWGATITGQVGGRPFTAFEYAYVTGGGKHSNHHRLTAMLWESAEANLPRFSLGPESFFHRMAQRFGKQDFDFEEDPEFSRAYQLQGDDERAVRALFTSTRRAMLMAEAPDGRRAPKHHLAGAGTRLLWWRDGRLPGPDDLDQLIADGDRLRRLFMESREDA